MNIRILLGPHLDFFQEESIEILLSEPFTVTQQSDRMGYRLEGPRLHYKAEKNLRSEATTFGGIQVPCFRTTDHFNGRSTNDGRLSDDWFRYFSRFTINRSSESWHDTITLNRLRLKKPKSFFDDSKCGFDF